MALEAKQTAEQQTGGGERASDPAAQVHLKVL